MRDRLNAMRRVLAVQGQVKRLAEWQSAALETRKREIERLESELDGFFESPDLSVDLARLALRQHRRLAARGAATAAELALQAEATREARRRETLGQRMVDDLAADERRETEKRDLERLIEGFAAGPSEGGG